MASRNQPDPPPRHGFQYPSMPRVSARTCDSPPTAGQDEGADDEEAGQQHDELHGVDPDRGHQPPGREVDGHHGPADQRSDPGLEPAHRVEHRAHRDDLPGQDGEGGDPQEGRDEGANLPPVAVLEEVADRLQVVGLGEAPQPGAHPEREDDRPDARRPHPPPRAEAVAVPERGRPHGRPRPDVGREQGREEEPGPEAAARDEEVAGAGDPPAVPQPDRHEQSRVAEDDGEVEVHGSAGRSGVAARSRRCPAITGGKRGPARRDSRGCRRPRAPPERRPRPSPRPRGRR